MKKIFIIAFSTVTLITGLIFANSKKENYVQMNDLNLLVKKDSVFKTGKELFKTNCIACHYIGMDKRATAVALGGITKKREKDWLYQYTRRSYQMLVEGDSLAKIISANGGGLMTSFPNLTDKDLDHIYHFVEKRYEMSLNGIPVPINFEFKETENNRAKACSHILRDKEDILRVSVSKNRIWNFSCLNEIHARNEWQKTTLKKMFEYDKSINDLIFLMPEYPAIRKSKHTEWDFE